MSGAHYPPYSPTATHQTRPLYPPHDQIYPPNASNYPIPSSPHRPVSAASPLLPPTTALGQPPPGPAPYPQSITSSPIYQTQRPYSGTMAHASIPPPYDGTPTSHSRPPMSPNALLHSPPRDRHSMTNGYTRETPNSEPPRPTSQEKPDRTSNPMSFASILGPSNNEPSAKTADPIRVEDTATSHTGTTEATSHAHASAGAGTGTGADIKLQPPSTPLVVTNGNILKPHPAASDVNRDTTAPSKTRKKLTVSETDRVHKVLLEIDEQAQSEGDETGFYDLKQRYLERGRKRARAVDDSEHKKQKRRRTHLLDHLIFSFSAHAATASERFRERFEATAIKEINDQDVHAEKERKKDMQRKRRREQQIKAELQRLERLEEAQAHAREADDLEVLQRHSRAIEKSKQKIQATTELLEGGERHQDEIEAPPLAPNLEGGTISSFHLGSEEPPEPQQPPKKKTKTAGATGNRPKKSKEKKQAEKDMAEAAYAAMERDALVTIAPKEETKKEPARPKKSKAEVPVPGPGGLNFESKGYNQIYEQIIRDMSRKDVPKVYRIKQLSLSTRQENMRKTVILASKQARKWQERTNKSMKDTQARAKRVMREMMSFWKRNEREERDLRRLAEKKEIEDARKAEADREANRQRRKLNFLISQTEIYSHFVGKKVKTDEVEKSTDDPSVAVSTEKIRPGDPNAHVVDLPASVADLTGRAKTTNFEDLDFDAEDDTALRAAAMANAQNAMQEAQDKARAFNGEAQMAQFDDGDMNFQNPTMAGDVQVEQPRMLMAQLKEYQLKGLNWLANLYEQGINGILADEMGLGKTIQSISVMGYLAEAHNIWGPFLVIAPSSTLHNWQQEVTRFVPNIKVLPYWGNAKDRKTLRKFWDRKHITYTRDSEFHVLVTSYQLVVQDAQYFQKIRWQYMILDEAQAIKSSQSSRWKVLLGFHCRNRLLLTGTPIQNNMQELWALLHFIMPTLFDSHDEFSEWFSKDIESHAQSNTKLNQDQLKRLHMILKPFMLRRVKAHVQKELGDKVEKDVFCELTYRQRAYYANLRSKISIMDLIEKATLGDDQDAATLMNLVMQFRKVCNHPDLFERADTASPFSMSYYAETASFLREGSFVLVRYSIRNLIQYDLPRMLCNDAGRLDVTGPDNQRAGFVTKYLHGLMNVWSADNIWRSSQDDGAFSFLRFTDTSAVEAGDVGQTGLFERAISSRHRRLRAVRVFEDRDTLQVEQPTHALFNIVDHDARKVLAEVDPNSALGRLCDVSKSALIDQGYSTFEPAARNVVVAPPIQISAFDQASLTEQQVTLFNPDVRNALYNVDTPVEARLLRQDVDPKFFPPTAMLPRPDNEKARYTGISVPSMRRFVTDSGKLAKLDELLRELKANGHRVLLYFQMTRMINLMEEYLTYRNYKYCRLDGSTKLEDRRDTVHDFQTRPEIFIFLLSTRAGGLGINLTSADTVIFYDSDWNPTIDSQAMDRAHRLGQTKQVTVYRLITRGTIEERIRKRAMQKEEVQRVVITGGDGGGVDFNTRDRRENRTKDIAMWLADDDQAALIEQKEKENATKQEDGEKISKKKAAAAAARKRKGEMSLDDMYHEGEGNFDDQSAKPSGAATPVSAPETPGSKRGPRGGSGKSKKAKTAKQRLAIVDAEGDLGMGS